MAEVKNVAMQVLSGTNDQNVNVKVNFTLAFSAVEAGKSFQYGINLHGEDKAGDDEGNIFTDGQLLYMFSFGSFPAVKSHKAITAQAGEHSYSETRTISVDKLNEDPGYYVLNPDINTSMKFPHKDEVYASVNLVADEERSPAVSLFIL